MTRKSMSALLLGVAFVAWGCQKQQTTAASPSPSATLTEDEKAIAALGGAIGEQANQAVKSLNLTPAEQQVLKKALEAALAGQKPEYAIQQYGQRLQARAQTQATALAAVEKQKAAGFREAAAKEPGAVTTPSGLIFKQLQPGTGARPKPTDVVRVKYRGTLTDGKEFDSSEKHGGVVPFQVNGVIPCWGEGVQRMKVGEKAKLVCPAEIAYGDRGQGEIPPGATLVFEVELVGIGGPNPAAAAGKGR